MHGGGGRGSGGLSRLFLLCDNGDMICSLGYAVRVIEDRAKALFESEKNKNTLI